MRRSKGEGTTPPVPTPATAFMAVLLGALNGLVGIEHGIFEALQGQVGTGSLLIKAIGPAQRLWEGGSEPAFTLFPTYLSAGIAAIAVSALVIAWALLFMKKRYGWLGLLLLSAMQFLAGGGIAPTLTALIACLAASRIGRLPGRRPGQIAGFLSRAWPWLLGLSLFLFAAGLEYALIGWFFGIDRSFTLLYGFAYGMLASFVLLAFSARSRDAVMAQQMIKE